MNKRTFIKNNHIALRGNFNSIKYQVKNIFAKINKDAIFLFGNQKSGTSVIAALLSKLTDLSLTLDINTFSVEEQDKLHSGELLFSDFIKNHRFDFSKNLIKEPALTFLYSDVKKNFNIDKSVFIIRDPRDNIRSILNRIKKRGDNTENIVISDIPKAWNRIVDNRWLNLEHTHYIDSLAARWNLAADVYLNNQDNMILIKYEDFMADKIYTIKSLAKDLGLPFVNDISQSINIQYQPKGNSQITWDDFFKTDNLNRINKICKDKMKIFNYPVSKNQNI